MLGKHKQLQNPPLKSAPYVTLLDARKGFEEMEMIVGFPDYNCTCP